MLTQEFLEKYAYKKLWFRKFRIFKASNPIKVWIEKFDGHDLHTKYFLGFIIIWRTPIGKDKYKFG